MNKRHVALRPSLDEFQGKVSSRPTDGPKVPNARGFFVGQLVGWENQTTSSEK